MEFFENRNRITLIIGLFFFLFFSVFCSFKVQAAETVTIVIDPGHGGSSLGGQFEEYEEKRLTMAVATAMKEELEQFNGIKVYLTRDSDEEMSLKERVEYAESVQADFIFCLHFNMSVSHQVFGSEVWVSAFGEEYQKGYTFADIQMKMFEELGLYSRGIKTKINDEGEDYYGIIRHATAAGIPAVIIEHCHLDQQNDMGFYNSEEKLNELGRLDASAVAGYFGLISDKLSVNYSSFPKIEASLPDEPVYQDETPPEFCRIEAAEANLAANEVSVTLSAKDNESGIIYYSYSYDGGQNFSELMRWEEKDSDSIVFLMQIPKGITPEIVVKAYNAYDLSVTSEPVLAVEVPNEVPNEVLNKEPNEEPEAVEAGHIIDPDSAVVQDKTIPTENENTNQEMKYLHVVLFVCVGSFAVLFICIGILILSFRSKKKRRRR